MPENNQDIIRLRGSLQIKLEGADGTIKGERTIENLVVLNGRSRMLWRVINTVTNTDPIWNGINQVVIGQNSSPAPAATDTNLNASFAYLGWWSILGITTTNITSSTPKVVFSATIQGSDGGGSQASIGEIGLFHGVATFNTAGLPGNLFSRATFTQSSFGPTDNLQCTWTISG